ncbi:MAG: Superoxide dismutase [Fe] [Candidatus Woesearchaeota archaeon]|nr:Superoxide dismutase [Fe] [Candidatus Woesearchaeota archaeon]
MAKIKKLDYAYDALEPYIDEKTMRIHHSKHHQGYFNKFNKALENNPELQKKEVVELIKNLDQVPQEIKTTVRRAGGGHLNHSMFWKILKKDQEFTGKTAEMIKDQFGSFDKFKQEFTKVALSRFGSGWAWLVLDKDKLKVMNTPNQDNPLTKGLKPLLLLDVWEHAYYLNYQNKRAEYVENFFKIINWQAVDKNLEKWQQ